MTLLERAQNHLMLIDLGLSDESVLDAQNQFSMALGKEIGLEFERAGLEKPFLRRFGPNVSLVQGFDPFRNPYWIKIMFIEQPSNTWSWNYNSDISGDLRIERTNELAQRIAETAVLVHNHRLAEPAAWERDTHQQIIKVFLEEINEF